MRIPVAITALALTLAACGGSPSTAPASSATDSASAVASSSALSAALGASSDLGNGVSVTVTAPTHFTPGSFASNFAPGQVPNIVTITVANKGTSPLDMSSVIITPTSGANSCSDVLDGDNGINGAPTDPLAAGASAAFKFGIACDGKVGNPLTVGVQVGDKSVEFTGTLA